MSDEIETLRRDVASLALQMEMQAKSIVQLSQALARVTAINERTHNAFTETTGIVKELQTQLMEKLQ